jgi:cardiolipin synthase
VEFIWTIALTIIGTLIAVIAIANFRKPEKEPHHKVKHHYGILDPQLKREMGTLLGPAILPGSQVRANNASLQDVDLRSIHGFGWIHQF